MISMVENPREMSKEEVFEWASQNFTEFEERFWEKVNKGDTNDCWEWDATTHPFGYGSFSLCSRKVLAHRVSYTIENGPPGELHVLHSCDNPPCCNPNHLYGGTQSDNMVDAWERSIEDRDGPEGSEVKTAKLDEEAVLRIRERYDAENITQKELGDEYGVDQTTISRIVRGDDWKHVSTV